MPDKSGATGGGRRIPLILIFLALLAAAVLPAAARAAAGGPFPPFYMERGVFLRAMARAKDLPPQPGRVTGLTLPHHLLAADLMANGLAGLRERRYERIILLSPDHFKRGATPFSVPARDFSTCLGPVSLDRAGAAVLLENPLVSASNLFSHEHGVQALLPFLASWLPDTPVLPVALSLSSRREGWDSLAASLRPLLTDNTLIIQSTDYSHYLGRKEAAARDAETLRVIASGREELALSLQQPAHLDSKAAQYLQMRLQRERFGARALVTANRNSFEYLPPGQNEKPGGSTSYIVQVYSPDALPLPADLPGYVLAGDFFTGRYLQKYMEPPEQRAALARKILDITGGRPLILNFEGVLLPDHASAVAPTPESSQNISRPPESLRLAMPEQETLALLREINCAAVSLANNHSNDFGPEQRTRTRELLEASGIPALEDGALRAFPQFTLAALTDLDNNAPKIRNLLSRESFGFLTKADKSRPLVALVHCGREFFPAPGPRERALVGALEEAGVSLFVGAHPHRTGIVETDARALRVWSLGNFLFDQPGDDADGAVLDLVFFPQGTWWARQRSIGNLYRELGKR